MYKIYQVQGGDTLASIAEKLGVDTEELARLNGLMVGAVLSGGDYIVIPSKGNENSYFRYYKVKKGDTVYGIAREYNLDPTQLLRLNGLGENDVIYPDQELVLPNSGVSFYVTGMDDTLKDVTNKLGASANDISNQNDVIYLTTDQLIVYKK